MADYLDSIKVGDTTYNLCGITLDVSDFLEGYPLLGYTLGSINEITSYGSFVFGLGNTVTGSHNVVLGDLNTVGSYNCYVEGTYNTSSYYNNYTIHIEGREHTVNVNMPSGAHIEGVDAYIDGSFQHIVGIDGSNGHVITHGGLHYIPGIGGYTGTSTSGYLDLASVISNIYSRLNALDSKGTDQTQTY